jgi:hypothetical protein
MVTFDKVVATEAAIQSQIMAELKQYLVVGRFLPKEDAGPYGGYAVYKLHFDRTSFVNGRVEIAPSL